MQARTVVAENLPADHSIETIEQLFGKVGNVKMVRICHPEAANGANQSAAKISKSEIVISNKVGLAHSPYLRTERTPPNGYQCSKEYVKVTVQPAKVLGGQKRVLRTIKKASSFVRECQGVLFLN